jgi:hypothetical protein
MYPYSEPNLTDYLVSLHKGQWFGFDAKEPIYENLVVYEHTKPTEQECIDGLKSMQDTWKSKEYQRKRASEYPNPAEYLDGVVKGDQVQIDKYIADCLAVKAKYSKGVS